jgi:nucleoside triphosphate pyrophosphatase
MIILASGSPRRAKLLQDAGIEFKIVTSDIEETFDPNLEPKEVAMYLAKLKAKHIASSYENDIVIGADTIVVYNNHILGKPIDEDDAFRMLKMLSNQCHLVYTGVSIIKGDIEDTFYDQTKVCMKSLSDLEIKAYIKTLEPMDKAGSYGIQGEGRHLVEKYDGDFFTIMGLPLNKVVKHLKKHM